MIRGLRPYSKYKDSGVPWLGKVPEHWEVRRLGASVRGCINGVWGSDPDGKSDLPCVRVADFDRHRRRVRMMNPTIRAIALNERAHRLLRPGDLLLEKSGGGDQQPVGMVVLYDHQMTAVCSNFIARMPVSTGYNSSFLNLLHFTLYAIQLNIRSIKQTTGIQNLDCKAYLAEPVAFPPLPEQTAIVRFLDWADRRIRRVIRARKRRITLLEEYKQAIIHQAVTGQIDVRTGKPYPKYKDSSVEWLGEVPEHWEVIQLGRCLRRIDQGWSPAAAEGAFERGQWAVLTLSAVKHGKFDPTAVKPIPSNLKIPDGIEISDGDLLLTRSNTRDLVGDVCIVWGARPRTILCDLIYRLVPREDMLISQFLMQQLSSWIGRIQIERDAQGSSGTMPKVSQGRMRKWEILVPPLFEQTSIIEFLDEQTERIDAAITADRRSIDLLNEFRTRLVVDVVTGKLDVREAAASIPDEPDEVESDNEIDALESDGTLDTAEDEVTDDE